MCEAVERTRSRGGRVIAVGTTAVRSLETAAAGGTLEPLPGDSRIFIYPGYEFRVIDGLVTNFHLPESTLLMLVCALAGRDETLAAYQHAVASATVSSVMAMRCWFSEPAIVIIPCYSSFRSFPCPH